VVEFVVEPVVVNHYNICVVNESSFIKNIDGSVPVEFDSLANMLSLEDITPVVNSLQDLQQLDSTHNSLVTIHTPLTFKKAHFVEKLKITSKWTNMLDERENYNIKEYDGPIQITIKPGRDRLKKVNTKSSHAKTS